MKKEYPEELIKSGVRGKYVQKYKEGTNIVLIEPDSESVNRTLRDYISHKQPFNENNM